MARRFEKSKKFAKNVFYVALGGIAFLGAEHTGSRLAREVEAAQGRPTTDAIAEVRDVAGDYQKVHPGSAVTGMLLLMTNQEGVYLNHGSESKFMAPQTQADVVFADVMGLIVVGSIVAVGFNTIYALNQIVPSPPQSTN